MCFPVDNQTVHKLEKFNIMLPCARLRHGGRECA